MYRWATKTEAERETEETERLVRPAPKKKPPRHDLRRERIDTEPDEAQDRDLSMNYKTIGGSVDRVLSRFAAESDKVTVRRKDTGKVVQVSEETLREDGGRYEKVEPEAKSKKDEAFYASAAAKLRALAKGNEALANRLKDFGTPGSQVHGMAKENPDFPAKAVLKGIELPEGVETIGDLVKAMSMPVPKKKKGPSKSKSTKAPKKPPEPESAPESEPEPPESEPSEEGEQDPSSEEPQEKPKPKKGEPKAPKEEPNPEPSEAEKAGVPAPKRREASEEEYQDAMALVLDTFPSAVAVDILAKNLHPDDTRTLVSSYRAAKARNLGDVSKFAEKAASFYETDIDRVRPPTKWSGQAFDELSPKDQAEAMRQHQMQTVALSLAAREQLSEALALKGLMGKPRVPSILADRLATFMLTTGRLEPKDQEKQAKLLAKGLRDAVVKSGARYTLSDGTVKALFGRLKGHPARKVAAAFLEANDYNHVKDRFLGSGPDRFSEWDKPGKIAKGIASAVGHLQKRAQLYGGSSHSAALPFKLKVLSKLKALAPEKYGAVRQNLDRVEADAYDREKRAWEKATREWESRKKKSERARKKWENSAGLAYRGDPPEEFAEPPPEPPIKPARYEFARKQPEDLKAEGQRLWEEQMKRSKAASSLDAISSYPSLFGEPYLFRGKDRSTLTQPHGAAMTTKLSAEQVKTANDILSRLDKMAATIQENHNAMGLPFETAKLIVNDLDRTADAVERLAFGDASFARRQEEILKTAQVLQKDPDEPYMDSFGSPTQPHQTEGDEPYMSAYADDQSSAVRGGKDKNGRPLAP